MSNSNKNPADETTIKTTAKAEKHSQMLYDFTKQGKGKWRIQNDVVMGGRSESQLKMTDENEALFSGRVSLEIMVVSAPSIKLPRTNLLSLIKNLTVLY